MNESTGPSGRRVGPSASFLGRRVLLGAVFMSVPSVESFPQKGLYTARASREGRRRRSTALSLARGAGEGHARPGVTATALGHTCAVISSAREVRSRSET